MKEKDEFWMNRSEWAEVGVNCLKKCFTMA